MPFEPAQVVVGAILGLAATGVLRFWQYGRDLYIASVNECCDTISEAARVATEYWTLPKSELPSDVSATSEQKEEHKTQVLNEAFLLGYQIAIDRSFEVVASRISQNDNIRSSEFLKIFRDALTGGRYGSLGREPDHERARQAQVYSSELIASIRSSARDALSVRGLLVYIKEYSISVRNKYLRP